MGEGGAASSLLSLVLVAGRIRSLEDIHGLILEYITLQDKKDFAHVIKNPEMGDDPGLSQWA